MGAFGERSGRVATVDNTSYGLVRDGNGPLVIGKDSAAIVTGLRRELDRVQLTHDSSCICIVSPDGEDAALAMDEFGYRFASKLRSYDAIYHFADDKYLVMLPHIGREDAVGVIKRLRGQVIGDPFSVDGGANVMVTASFGGTMLDSQAPLHEHIDRASEAHEWALKGMGDSICLWTPNL
jgi:hypothetical protein